ncbi:hypothetical protein JCM8097_006292 [Rhodosporidiobolus ruineniae]
MPASAQAELSVEEIPPLAFEHEDEVRAVLDRLKDDLRERVRGKVDGKGKGKGKGREQDAVEAKKVEELVLKDFYRKLEKIVLSNCTIAGHPYADYQRKKEKGLPVEKTQPFDDVLHQRVLNYQNELFDAREENARERVDAPARTAAMLQQTLELDQEHLGTLEAGALDVPEELPTLGAGKGKSRKSVGGALATEAPNPVDAEKNHEQSKRALDQLLDEVPRLTTAAEEATKVAVDAAALS